MADGNCGLYSFACGLIDAIITEKRTLTEQKFSEFRAKICESLPADLQKLETHENHGLYEHGNHFKQFIESQELSFVAFKEYLQEIKHPEQLEALNRMLSTPLRNMAKAHLEERYGETLPAKYSAQLPDYQYTDDDFLKEIAESFEIAIRLVIKYSDTQTGTKNIPEDSISLFSLYQQNEHWYYLLPQAQTNGLSTIIQPHQETPKNTHRRLTKLPVLKPKPVLSTFSDFSQCLEDTLQDLQDKLSRFESSTIKTEEINHIANGAKNNLASLQQNICADKLENYLNKNHFHTMEKELIKKGPLLEANASEPDAALATVMQVAELTKFYQCDSSIFFKAHTNNIQNTEPEEALSQKPLSRS